MKSIKNFKAEKIENLRTFTGGRWGKTGCGTLDVGGGYVMDYQCDIKNSKTGKQIYYGGAIHPGQS